jgi:ketosteroid isomerase-like protein
VSFDMESAVRRLIDESDVSQVILRYADGIDRRNFDQVWECFAPDAHVDGSAFSGPLDEYLPRLLDGVRSFGATQHFMGNQLRSVDGDTAHTETYAIAHHFRDPAGEEEALIMGVRYVDDLVRGEDGRWVISHRQATSMWMRRAGD